jgi:hypothetical protein
MLISMPTDTSTIFGVFQAIAGLLLNRDDFLPLHKVIQFRNFASDYFVATSNDFVLHCKTKLRLPLGGER